MWFSQLGQGLAARFACGVDDALLSMTSLSPTSAADEEQQMLLFDGFEIPCFRRGLIGFICDDCNRFDLRWIFRVCQVKPQMN